MSLHDLETVSTPTLLERVLDLERRLSDLIKSQTECEHTTCDSDTKQDQHQHQRDAEFELKRLGFELEQKMKESQIKDQQHDINSQRRALEIQQRDIDVQIRDIVVQKREIDILQRDIDAQKRDLETQPRDINSQKRDFEAQKLDIDAQIRDLEAKKQLFEVYKKESQFQFDPMLGQLAFTPFLQTENTQPSAPSLFDAVSGRGSFESEVDSQSKAQNQATNQKKRMAQTLDPFSNFESRLDSKLSEVQRGKRQLKLLSDTVTRGFDDLNLQKEQFAKSKEAMERSRLLLQEREDKMDQFEETVTNSVIQAQKTVMNQLLCNLNSLTGSKLAMDQFKSCESRSSISNLEFAHTLKIILDCNKNSKHYSVDETRVRIEFRCEQLSKQVHTKTLHYVDLLRRIFDTGDRKHINPHDSITTTSKTILSYFWKSDTGSGKAPKLTPDLKVFFSSPNISNGDWIQFHGPGTLLYQIDPGFKLTVGSLCDPDGKGSFTSIDSRDPASDPDNKYNGKTKTSDYQIKFKWE